MCVGQPPFQSNDQKQLFQMIIDRHDVQWPVTVTPHFMNLVDMLLKKDHKYRYGDPAVIKQHPWFHDLDLKKLQNRGIEAPFVPSDRRDPKKSVSIYL